MRRTKTRAALAAALACGLVFGSSALAGTTTIEDFDSFLLSGTYGAWADGGLTTITSGPTSYTVESKTFGGGFYDLNPNVDATGGTTIEFDVTIDYGDFPGVVLTLVDEDLTTTNYAWYGLAAGNHVLTRDILDYNFGDDPAGLDVSDLSFFHIQVDDGGTEVPYGVSFNNLSLTMVPEPASIVLLLGGLIGLIAAGRRSE